jgi:hypothetical protein
VTLATLLAMACSHPEPDRAAPSDAASAPAASAPAASVPGASVPGASVPGASDAGAASSAPVPATPFAEWLRAHAPKTATISFAGDAPKVTHTVQRGDTHASIAQAYLDVTGVYSAKELTAILQKQSPSLAAGTPLEIPNLLKEPYKDPEHDRLGWPEDKALRGVFITGTYAGLYWAQTIEKLAARKVFNAVVLDAKDYDGPVNYPTKAKIAREIDADHGAQIPDMARAIRYAHARGLRVILRIPCFHDPLAAKKAKRLSLMGYWNGPIDMGWLDPMNEEAQGYVLELVEEAIGFGADEIQLDYIRFPVVGPVKAMKLPPPKNGERITIIRDIVRKVHAVTSKHGVPLSLDIFGVTATGDRSDWEALGQDISVLGPECEALSPMVYPSHYDSGYRNMAEPGAHPEIVGIGTKAAVGLLPKGKKNAVIRSWLQAFGWKAPNYGPKYLVDEARGAEANGGVGWLMWSPSNDYYAAWLGFPAQEPLAAKDAKQGKQGKK